VTADTPWCNRGAVSLGGRGLRQLVTADTPWCNRSAVSQLILPGVTAARLAVLTVRRRFGGRGLLWGLRLLSAVLAHPWVTSLAICSTLGSRAVPMALRKANRACESYCSWSAGLPAAALAAFGSQYSVDRPSIGMVAHNFALC